MIRSLSIFLIAGLVLLAGRELLDRSVVPCEKPIPYFVGTFNREFDLTKEEFLAAIRKAEAVWEGAIGQELFAYEPEEGRLAINLIYDYRQAVTEELGEIETVVKTGEASYDALNARYQALKSQYAVEKRSYDAAVVSFNQKSQAYEQSVERWNKGRRSSKAEFDQLEAERVALEAQLAAVKAQETELNALVQGINSVVVELNALARTLNLNVEQYNEVGASRGDTFAGGVYTSDAAGERIDIYEFENEDKLVRVLAHELGHALGLDHLDDPQAIMYYLNKGEADRLTQADLNALKLLCGVQ